MRSAICIAATVALSGVAAAQSTHHPSRPAPRTRNYFVAVDTVRWDYVPGGIDQITGHPYSDTAFFRDSAPKPVATSYLKLLYREYTDSTFRTLKAPPAEWRHLGFLGPVLRAVVGDTIRVVFRNNGPRHFSMHPHGVFYAKSSEGAPYQDGTSGADTTDDGVPPGGTHVYVWAVPARAGPGPNDGSSVLWMYHSHTDEVRDVNSGLIGPMIITARDKARADGTPVDVDRELVVAFAQVHEEGSWLAAANLAPFAQRAVPRPPPSQDGYPYFVEFSINGFTHGALPLEELTIKKGQRVRWYVFASTNDFDVHAPHWHGNTVLVNGMRTDVLSLNFMQMIVADMTPDDPGIWLFHCHVSFHSTDGMQVRYRVTE
jgi:manganese oxidase